MMRIPSPVSSVALENASWGGGRSIVEPEFSLPGAAFSLGVSFRLQFLAAGEAFAELSVDEVVWVLLWGAATAHVDGGSVSVGRTSLFDAAPSVIHVGPGTPFRVEASRACEWAVIRTGNTKSFAPKIFLPADLHPEYRGAGLVQNACLRNVRLIFDRASRPDSNLVVGEVVNYPGRWSSYPPHHHDQPEIYHYRFTAPTGYGHAELGEEVLKVRHGDTVVIPPGLDHAQVSAPGYGMYYLWMIRHLPGNPYTGFTFAPEHQWTLDSKEQGWRPADLPGGLS